MAQRIRTDDGYLTELGRVLGQTRLEQFISGHAQLQAMSLFLVLAVSTTPQAGYSDASLQAMLSDADDVLQAAEKWVTSVEHLADAWQRQRITSERGRQRHG